MAKSNEKEALSGLTDGAQQLAGPHAGSLRERVATPDTVPLAALAKRRVTVKLPIRGLTRLVTGTAAYEPGIGLSIVLDDDAQTEIHLSESAWNGRITPEAGQDSDYLISFDAIAAAPLGR